MHHTVDGVPVHRGRAFNDRFAWNFNMMSKANCAFSVGESRGRGSGVVRLTAVWMVPLVHGHVDQASECHLLRISRAVDQCFRAYSARPSRLRDADSEEVKALCRRKIPEAGSER